MKNIGIDYYAVSSTTQCEHNYEMVLAEMKELICLNGDKVLPVMWITPDSLKGNIAWYLGSEIKWKMLKIHPFLNKTEWHPDGNLFAEVLDIARELKLPLLIHTGNDACCSAELYEEAIKKNEDICFILAHGRPVNSAIRLAKEYPNAFADSAFMPLENIKQFVDHGLSNKLLWGTDMCIPQYLHPNINLKTYYRDRLNALPDICTRSQFEHITYRNAQELFNLSEKPVLPTKNNKLC